jgi:hypothetical protein
MCREKIKKKISRRGSQSEIPQMRAEKASTSLPTLSRPEKLILLIF